MKVQHLNYNEIDNLKASIRDIEQALRSLDGETTTDVVVVQPDLEESLRRVSE